MGTPFELDVEVRATLAASIGTEPSENIYVLKKEPVTSERTTNACIHYSSLSCSYIQYKEYFWRLKSKKFKVFKKYELKF